MFIFALVLMPETLFDRPAEETNPDVSLTQDGDGSDIQKRDQPLAPYAPPPLAWEVYLRRLWFWDLDRPHTRYLRATDFVVKPLSMLKYPSVAFPALY